MARDPRQALEAARDGNRDHIDEVAEKGQPEMDTNEDRIGL